MNRIHVTCAIILQKGCVLACQRSAKGQHALQWEFPGGKIEIGETDEACILREIKEELNVTFEISGRLKYVDFDYPLASIRLIPFLGSIGDKTPRKTEHEVLNWLPIDKFSSLNWSAADEQLFWLNEKEIRCGLI